MKAHTIQYAGYWIDMLNYIYHVRGDDPKLNYTSCQDAINRIKDLIKLTENYE